MKKMMIMMIVAMITTDVNSYVYKVFEVSFLHDVISIK